MPSISAVPRTPVSRARSSGRNATDKACTGPGAQLARGRRCGPAKVRRGKGADSAGSPVAVPTIWTGYSAPSKIQDTTASGVAG